MLINRKLLKLQFPANHLLMGFWNALSDGEVKFDLNMILVAQNAKKWGFDLLKSRAIENPIAPLEASQKIEPREVPAL